MSLITFSVTLLCIQLLQWGCQVLGFPIDQHVFNEEEQNSILNVRHELIKAEIIPTVIDDFLPTLTFTVSWPSNNSANLGNTLKPKDLQESPEVKLYDKPTASYLRSYVSNMTYTIALTDPDAPSRDNPEWSEVCHWIVTGVPISGESPLSASGSGDAVIAGNDVKEIMEYKPPGPPPKTGKHRYVFLAFAPANGTSIPLDLSKPKDRKHWGTGEERVGVRRWAEENGLVPVAANFIYAQNKKQ